MIMILAAWASPEASLLGLWKASLLCPQMDFPLCTHFLVCLYVPVSSSYKGIGHIGLGASLPTFFNLIISLKVMSPNAVTF